MNKLLSTKNIAIFVFFILLIIWFFVEGFSWAEISANAFTEVLGILVTLTIIDWVYENKSKKELRDRLVREMSSHDNGISRRAIQELRAHGWLTSGQLIKSWIQFANLEGAELQGADLRDSEMNQSNLSKALLYQANLANAHFQSTNFSEAWLVDANLENTWLEKADLSKSNLTNANLTNANLANANLIDAMIDDAQLATVKTLKGCIMPSGKLYNGRFNLDADIQDMNFMIGVSAISSPADYYGVEKAVYERGQEWYSLGDPPVMYSPNIEEWYLVSENPDGQDLY